MKWRSSFIILLLALTLGACASYEATRVLSKGAGQKQVFNEVAVSTPIPNGYCDLTIRLALKTFREDRYLIKTIPTRPRDYAYPVVVNIDGQGAKWKAECSADKQERYFSDGRHNPEGGDGLKCIMDRSLQLKSGDHVLYVALPEERIEREVKINLVAGRTNNIELKPVYRRDRIFGPDFLSGVGGLVVLLNGNQLKARNLSR